MDSIYIRVTINQFFVKLLRSTVSVTFFQLRFKQKGKTGIFSAALCNTRRWPKKLQIVLYETQINGRSTLLCAVG